MVAPKGYGNENADQHQPPRQRAIDKTISSPEVTRHREFPQTPVARVPFADLVENGETLIVVSPVRTPTEGVTWRQSPSSSDRDLLSQQHGKKHARSSSPPSSQRSQPYLPRPMLAPVNLQDLHQSSLRAAITAAPHDIDPAIDLEKQYFGANSLTTPSKLPSSAAADLMHSSSPRTPALSLNNSAKMRRTRSCGIAFPTSDTKRRRIVKSYSHVGHNSPFNDVGQQPRDPRKTKMSLLLDKVDEGLLSEEASFVHTQRSNERSIPAAAEMPDSSNTNRIRGLPASVRVGLQSNPDGAATREHKAEQELRLNALSQDVARASLVTSSDGKSSEYGDNDLDEGLVSLTEKQGSQTDELRKSEDQASRNASLKRPEHSSPSMDCNGDDDDDDEDDFMKNLTEADLEQLTAPCDQIRQSQLPGRISSTREVLENPAMVARFQGSPATKQKPQPDIIDLSDGEFGDEDFEDIARECDVLAAAAEQSSTDSVPLIPRYVVRDVFDGVYTTDKGYARGEKIVHMEDARSKARRIVVLREAWLDSPVESGAFVHVLARFDSHGLAMIDNLHGLLIIHPDHLFSATVVADAFKCTRRAVLQDRVKATNEVNESQVYGHILHEVFQEALRANQWDKPFLEGIVRDTATRFLESLFELNIPLELSVVALMNKLENVDAWAKQYVSAKARPGATVQGPHNSELTIGINKLLDVEEHIWSPRYGLKGNVDATIQIHTSTSEGEKQLTVPFELKTGRAKNDTSHNSQTALYTLLLSDRYDIQTTLGILHYLETNVTNQVLAPRRDILHMIMKRNDLAVYARKRTVLPPMLKNEFTCGRCYAQTSCFVYHKLSEAGNGKTSGIGETFTNLIGHLQPLHAEFFTKWDDLLTKEESDVLRFRRELWTMLSSEREKVGRCFGGVIIKPGSAVERTDVPKINRFEYVFVKQNQTPGFTFADSQLSVGEPIVISDEKGHFALANGYVTRIRSREIAVAVDRRLHNARTRDKNFHPETNQSHVAIMELDAHGSRLRTNSQLTKGETTLYRIDKDEFSNGMATVRNNLVRMMEKDLFGANMLRRLIVEGVSPTFRRDSTSIALAEGHKDLNVDQKDAIQKVLSSDNYALVLGMPGTGKTTTIAHLIRALAAKGKSILLTSYTHTAVDNILLKIRDTNLSVLRIGAESKIHPEVQEFADLACRPKSSFEAIQTAWQSTVVATTCLGINHPVFNHRTFDYCIVDEASQITLPVCLGPIRMAHRFVLVGDHYQLPPLVQNEDAKEGGLDVSLFKLLSDRHPTSVVNLAHQYRMCEDIMSLSNSIIYRGLLKCGTPAVARRQISIPDMNGLKFHHHSLATLSLQNQIIPCTGPVLGDCWLRDVLEPTRRVIFINTDALGHSAQEVVNGSRISNPVEVSLTSQIVRALLSTGVAASDVGIMTLYRSQLALLRQALRPRNMSSLRGPAPMPTKGTQGQDTTRVAEASSQRTSATALAALEMHTTDKFQGRDKEAIVLSLVRSNEKGIIGDLLQDWRRLNVALTRARTKLVIVGSLRTMKQSGNASLGELCAIMETRGWTYDLKEGALGQHWFEDGITQSTGFQAAQDLSPVRTKPKRGKMTSPVKVIKGFSVNRIIEKRPVLRDVVNGVVG